MRLRPGLCSLVIDTLIWLGVLVVLVATLNAAEPTPAQQALARLRAMQSADADLFAPYVPPVIETPAVESREEELGELLTIAQAVRMTLPGQVFLVGTQANCPPCERFKRDIAPELSRLGWTIVYVRVDKASGQNLAKYYGIAVTPTVIALEDGLELDGIEGCPASAKACTDLFRKDQPLNREPFAHRQENGPSQPCYYVRGGWTWPGCPSSTNLRSHLCRPPHNYDRSYVYGLSPSQCVQLHDSWHNQHGGSGRGRRRDRRTSIEGGEVLIVSL